MSLASPVDSPGLTAGLVPAFPDRQAGEGEGPSTTLYQPEVPLVLRCQSASASDHLGPSRYCSGFGPRQAELPQLASDLGFQAEEVHSPTTNQGRIYTTALKCFITV